jgi:hypothetical protein
MFRNMIAPLIPAYAHFLAFIEAAAENSSWKKSNTDVGQ